MRVKEETSWEAIVLAGDGTTWRAEDWVWDAASLTAQPKRRSARLGQVATAAKPTAARPCAAAARLAPHLALVKEEPVSAGDASALESAKPLSKPVPLPAGGSLGDSSGSSRSGSGSGAGAGRATGGSGGKAAKSSKAQLASRRPVCQADGCHRDLSTLTYYHQRNRICEVHIKALEFSRNGEALRFCQRCGHSHALAEFDADKHSCRKQLEKHNARRRKNQGPAPQAPAGAKGSKAGAARKGSSGVKLEPEVQQQQQQEEDVAGDSSPCASSSAAVGKGSSASAGAQEGGDGSQAGGTGLSRAQQRLAARIARLAAEGADVSVLEQGVPASLAPAAATPPAPNQMRQQQQQQYCQGELSPQLSESPPTVHMAPETETPELASLVGMQAAAGTEAAGQGEGEQRPMSPLLPLLDFDLGHFPELEVAPPAGPEAGQAGSTLADDLSEWITQQLSDHAMLCEPAQHVQQPAEAAHAPAPAPAPAGDTFMSLFDDLEVPTLPDFGPAAAGSTAFAAAAPLPAYGLAGAQQLPLPPPPPQQQQQQQWAAAFQLPPAAAAPPALPPLPHSLHQAWPAQQQDLYQPGGSSFSLASSLVGVGAPAATLPPPPDAQATLTKVSVKLFGCTPEELPIDLRQQVTSWFGASLERLDGYIRPGCVHLTVQAVLQTPDSSGSSDSQAGSAPATSSAVNGEDSAGPGQQAAAGGQQPTVRAVLSSMLDSGCDLWRRKTLLIQCGGELALVHDGALRKSWDVRTAAAARAVPQIQSVSPPVVAAGRPGAVQLAGVNLMQDDCQLLARMHGAYVALPDARCTDCCCRAPAAAVGAGAAGPGCGGCCRGEGGEEPPPGWEQRCCGCCTAKLQPGPGAPQDAAGGASAPAGRAAAARGEADQQPSLARPQQQRGPSSRPQLQSVRLLLPQQGLAPGLLHVDVQRGAFSAPQGARLLVVESEAVQEEVWGLQGWLAPQAFASALNQLGLVYDWIGGGGGAEQYGLVERTAAGLLYWCASCGLAATAEAMLRLLARHEGTTGLAGALARAQELACHDGLSLLHRALQSRSLAMTQAVLAWGEEAGEPWACDLPGPLSITPLHLAVVVPDPATAAALLEQLLLRCTGGPAAGVAAWRSARTADGLTPEQFAGMAGTAGAAAAVVRQLEGAAALAAAASSPRREEAVMAGDKGEQQQQEEEEEEEHAAAVPSELEPSASVQEPSTPRRCRCTADCPCKRAVERCSWCTGDDPEPDWLGEAAASAGGGASGKACGLDGGKCACCCGGGGSDASLGGGGNGSKEEGSDGGGGGGGGGGAQREGGSSSGGGCCGGGKAASGHGPSANSGRGGGSGGCCGGGGAGSKSHGALTPPVGAELGGAGKSLPPPMPATPPRPSPIAAAPPVAAESSRYGHSCCRPVGEPGQALPRKGLFLLGLPADCVR